ncbi:MAG: hypothetical protein K6C34_03235 [Alphaproteobacteria bacterium]|nr:hypothetical protein [Alphaproteobacteria bacterium]
MATYSSISAASKTVDPNNYRVLSRNIMAVLREERKTAGGFVWKRTDEEGAHHRNTLKDERKDLYDELDFEKNKEEFPLVDLEKITMGAIHQFCGNVLMDTPLLPLYMKEFVATDVRSAT